MRRGEVTCKERGGDQERGGGGKGGTAAALVHGCLGLVCSGEDHTRFNRYHIITEIFTTNDHL